MLCLIVPSVTLVLKLVLVLPCVNHPLMRIRQGWERNRLKDEMGELKATNMWSRVAECFNDMLYYFSFVDNHKVGKMK